METINRLGAFATGFLAGAACMFAFDPVRGRSRRKKVSDKLVHAEHEALAAFEAAAHDFAHRSHGTVAELKARLRGEQPIDDVLVERVRAQLGRLCSHPRAIEVAALGDGRIRLSGPVLAREAEPLLLRVRYIRGVHGVEDALERHEQADLSSLQGGQPAGFHIGRRSRSPAWRCVIGLGLAAAAVPLARRAIA
jgi:hypothetical protein